jgi:hypothetical protein
MKKEQMKSERGMILIEGVLGMLVSVIVMAILLSLGFFLYQKSMVDIVAGEIAEEVVTTYKFRDIESASDITLDKVTSLGMYRMVLAGMYKTANEKKATNIADHHLSKTSLAKAGNGPTVKIVPVGDDVGRIHYEVTLTQEYTFLMSDLLNIIGLKDMGKISSTVYVTSTDVGQFINTVKLANYGLKKFKDVSPLTKAMDSVIKAIRSIYKVTR